MDSKIRHDFTAVAVTGINTGKNVFFLVVGSRPDGCLALRQKIKLLLNRRLSFVTCPENLHYVASDSV